MSTRNRLLEPAYQIDSVVETGKPSLMPTNIVGFAPCPSAILEKLTQEQCQELQMIYQRAFDLARLEQVSVTTSVFSSQYHGRN